MVRIKNRYLLIQILYPMQTHQTPPQSSSLIPLPLPATAAAANAPAAAHHRYLLSLHAPTPDAVGAGLLLRHVRAALTQLFGDAGAGLAGSGLAVKYWSNATSTFVLRCRREVVRWVWAAVAFVRVLPVPGGGAAHRYAGHGQAGQMVAGEAARECVMRVVRVSGTMKKCQEELVRRARALLGRVKGIEEVVKSGGFEDGMGQGDGDDEDLGRGGVGGKGKGKVRAVEEEDLGIAVHDGLDESEDEDEMDV